MRRRHLRSRVSAAVTGALEACPSRTVVRSGASLAAQTALVETPLRPSFPHLTKLDGRTPDRSDVLRVEEQLIAIFKRYARGRCQNASDRALRANRSAVGRHWVYVCLPRGVVRPPAPRP